MSCGSVNTIKKKKYTYSELKILRYASSKMPYYLYLQMTQRLPLYSEGLNRAIQEDFKQQIVKEQ